jgi:PTH2 family peptidyl-tRNA hydrolase
MKENDRIKQTIIIRKDLNMSKGKMVVQGAHASIAFLTNKMKDNLSNPEALWWVNLSQAEKEWVYGTFFKVCVGVDSEKELLDIGYNAVMLGLSVKYIEETTGFDKPTVTCLAIGPDYSSKIDPVTKHLKLL